MRVHIGIITAGQSLKNLLLIEVEMRKLCDITFLPYSSPVELINLYLENEKKFDGILFSGIYPYRYITNTIGEITKPCCYLDLKDRDIYLAVARLLAQNPSIDLKRVIFDINSMDRIRSGANPFLEEIFPQGKQMRISEVAEKDFLTQNINYLYEATMNEYRKCWNSGTVDLFVIRMTNLAKQLEDERIPYMLVRPCKATMMEYFQGLLNEIDRVRMENALTACCMIEVSQDIPTQENLDMLKDVLEQFNSEQNIIFVLRQNGTALEATTSNATVRKLTSDYTTCLLTSYLYEALPFSTHIGWGIGYDIVTAHQNARRAIRQSKADPSRYTYLVNEEDKMVGPLCGDRTISYQLRPSTRTNHIAKMLGISAVNLEKVISLQKNRGMTEFSASDLVFYLDITPRSATRILKKLVEHGAATKITSMNLNGRGRPAAIYEINFEKIQL